jgi:hypothetical protein
MGDTEDKTRRSRPHTLEFLSDIGKGSRTIGKLLEFVSTRRAARTFRAETTDLHKLRRQGVPLHGNKTGNFKLFPFSRQGMLPLMNTQPQNIFVS